MPTYQYECRNCQHELEQYQSFKDEPLVKCPKCKKNELFKVVTGGHGFFLSNRTVGAIADKNDAKFSKDFKQHLKKKNSQKKDVLSPHLQDGASITKPKESTKKPWFAKDQKVSDKKLKAASPQEQLNYIEKGHL